jgi:hypothetical protein
MAVRIVQVLVAVSDQLSAITSQLSAISFPLDEEMFAVGSIATDSFALPRPTSHRVVV